MRLWPIQRGTISPHEDYGFFGPGSVTWKVWSYPTSLTVGFQRAVVVEELDPALVASVDATRAIWDRPRSRYDRTIRYFALVAFGDSRSATEAADVLVKVHAKAVGAEPYSGERYDANDPRSQLWILLTGWHSVLYAYERFGRRISPSTVPVAGPALLGLPAVNPETTSPTVARQRLGFPKPSEAHREFRARQRARVFDEGLAPSDDGIVESEPILGSIA